MGGIAAVVKVDGMSSVKVLSLRSAIRITCVDGSCVVCCVQHEVVTVLACTILANDH